MYRKSSHTVYLLHYHFVFTTKYRKPVLRGDVAVRVRDLIREICRSNDIETQGVETQDDEFRITE